MRHLHRPELVDVKMEGFQAPTHHDPLETKQIVVLTLEVITRSKALLNRVDARLTQGHRAKPSSPISGLEQDDAGV